MSRTVIHLPAVALRGMTILPGMVAHFDISRERSIHAVEEAMVGDQKIFLITQQDASVEEPARDDLYQIGVIAEVKQVIKMPNEIVRVLVEGLERGELASFLSQEKYLMAEVILLMKNGRRGRTDAGSEGSNASLYQGNRTEISKSQWTYEQRILTSGRRTAGRWNFDAAGCIQSAALLYPETENLRGSRSHFPV